jgi:hypothetical protein
MDNVHIVTLGCHHCHGEHLHEVLYAGRLLASTFCSNCGHRIAKDLPAALLLKPAKMQAERRVLTGRRYSECSDVVAVRFGRAVLARSARFLTPLSIRRSMMKAPGSLRRIQKAVAGVSGQFTRQRLTSRQPCPVGYRARHQVPPSSSPATK